MFRLKCGSTGALLGLALSSVLAARAQQIRVTPDVPYTSDATGQYSGDLFQPSDAAAHPAVVLLHGGSWRSGHKSELRKLGSDLARDGFVAFSIDYDTHPHSFPTSWQEGRAAIAFVREHASAFGVDPARIAVLGTSAGGQIAALLALAPQGPSTSLGAAVGPQAGPLPPTPVPVAAGVFFNGGYDVHPRHWLLRRYLGGECAVLQAVCNDASPDFHVAPGAVPVFVGHGTHDHLIPYSQATTFVGLLQAAGDSVTPFPAEGAGHSYWRHRHWYRKNLAAAEAFLHKSLGE